MDNNWAREVAAKYLRKMRFAGSIYSTWWKLRRDENYRLELVDRAFLNREEPSDDTELLSRVVASYNKAKELERTKDPVYQVSNEWIPIYKYHLGPVMEALASEDIDKLGNIYGHFFRDRCSTGLVGLPLDMQKYYLVGRIRRAHKMLYLNDCLHRYRLWTSLLGNTHCTETLLSPNVGNPYGYFINGTFIRNGAEYQHYYATLIGRLVRGMRHPIIIELGGGFGGMGYYLARDNQDLTYIDFDLPENMALTAYYLLRTHPHKRIMLFGESELTPESINEHQIVILPSFEIPKLEAQSVDLVFNSYSLAEMSPETIRHFVSEFERVSRGYFLHVNHNKNSSLVADDFGVNLTRLALLYKIPAFWNAGKPWEWDEYEYLYQKPSGEHTSDHVNKAF